MNLIILGAGQLAEIAKEIAEAVGGYERIEFLDDINPAAIGKLDDYKLYKGAFDDAIVAIDDLNVRVTYFKKLKEAGFNIPKLIHPAAFVSPSSSVDEGTIVEPMSLLHTGTMIGKGCIIAEGSIIGHHSQIDDFCYIAAHSTVMQNTYMKPCTSTITGQLFFAEPTKRTVPEPHETYSFDSGM